MQEWLNWPAWKASKRQKRFRGSNPLLSATSRRLRRQNYRSAVFCRRRPWKTTFPACADFFARFARRNLLLSRKTLLTNYGVAGRKIIYFQRSPCECFALRISEQSDVIPLSANKNKLSSHKRCMKKTTGKFRPFSFFGKGSRHRHPGCGKRGIRTPGTLQFNGFQDRRNRPLCHLSSGKSNTDFRFRQIKQIRFGARIVKNSLTLLRVSPVPLFTTSLL